MEPMGNEAEWRLVLPAAQDPGTGVKLHFELPVGGLNIVVESWNLVDLKFSLITINDLKAQFTNWLFN